MAATAKQKKIDELLSKARESLRIEAWFEAERLAMKAMAMARQEQDFDRMARMVPALQECRRQRLQEAQSSGKVVVIDEPITEDMKIKKGCYVVQPPQVGLDARRLRMVALRAEVSVAVICREPLTQLKTTPIVAISPSRTLRVKVDPPTKPESPNMSWFSAALRSLGDWAIESMDTTMPVIRRIDALLEMLDALPEHENLHHALEAACREAHETDAREKAPPGMRPGAKTKIKT